MSRTTTEGLSADRAVAWLQTLSATWREADVPEATARRLGMSHSTVKHHPANARSKVGATTAQLVWILAPRLPVPEGRAHSDE